MIRIRINLTGRRNNRLFRINVVNSKKLGKILDNIGYYDKKLNININEKKYKNWIKLGVKPTLRVKQIFKKKRKKNLWKY